MAATKSRATFTLIESEAYKGAYDMPYVRAIIESEAHGRLVITQRFGGEGSARGGAYRWRHGRAYRVPKNALLEHYHACCLDELCESTSWTGYAVARVAESLGL